LIFSIYDLNVAGPIMAWAGIEKGRSFPTNSLIVQSLRGQFVSGGGLDVAYRNNEVVILQLTGH
jgi:hypothetical protein